MDIKLGRTRRSDRRPGPSRIGLLVAMHAVELARSIYEEESETASFNAWAEAAPELVALARGDTKYLEEARAAIEDLLVYRTRRDFVRALLLLRSAEERCRRRAERRAQIIRL